VIGRLVRRRRRSDADRLATDRQPRLALRFALVTALGLACAGAVILAAIREIDQRQAVRAASERTHFVAQSFLRGLVRPADAAAPVRGERRERLDALMRRHVLIDGVLRVSIVGAGDRITYSTDHRRVGKPAGGRSDLAAVRSGSILSNVTDVPAVERGGRVKALVSSVPVRLANGKAAVVSIEQDYAPIAAAARESLLPVAAVLELALILLFVLLLPALVRASRRLRAYVAEIRYQAAHDSLTGLTNRVALHDGLASALRNRAPDGHVAVLLIDLDRFKEVNDSLGHDAGDELLCEIARRLVGVAGEGRVSRLGGDEFAVVLDRTTPERAFEVAHALRRSIEAPGSIQDIPVSVDASVGMAIGPEDGSEVSQLVRRADVAMYVAKQARAGVVRYDPASDRNDAGKLVLMTELRVAVERGELEVHYQPIVNVEDGTLAKVEALVRWHHPTRGMIGPGVFVPLAAHTRLIVDLNSFVLREALRQCAVWRARGIDLHVSVNVTVLELLEASFPTNVAAALQAASFPASALTVELTEEALVQEPERVRRTIDALQALGVQVAIDDFGTGYSSLSYLKELPVDVLKIDRSFVADLPESHASLAIVAAAIELSHRLGLEVVAEGVETQAQYDCLVELGCDLIQGYHICRPVSAAKLTRMIDAQMAAPLDKAA
jgi:diguanylate cyclase (GGDEF)-like protein